MSIKKKKRSHDESFPCTQCGICCKHIDRIPALETLDRGDGQCIYLKGNLCSIYAYRPDICNVDKIYERFFKDKLTKEEYYQLNQQGCKELKVLI